MKRWTLRLMLLGVACAILPLLAAFVTPDPKTSPKMNSLVPSLLKSDSPTYCLFSQESPQESEEGDAMPSSSTSTERRNNLGYSYDQHDTPSEPYDLLFQQQNTDPFRADFRDGSEPKLMTTFGGGTSLMFEMIAKRMLDWGNEAKPYLLESENGRIKSPPKATTTETTTTTSTEGGATLPVDVSGKVLPRWHPHSGISDANPNFRSQAPAMTNQGEHAACVWEQPRREHYLILPASLAYSVLYTYARSFLFF